MLLKPEASQMRHFVWTMSLSETIAEEGTWRLLAQPPVNNSIPRRTPSLEAQRFQVG